LVSACPVASRSVSSGCSRPRRALVRLCPRGQLRMGGRRVGAPAQPALWRGEDDTRPVSECALTDLDSHAYHLSAPFSCPSPLRPPEHTITHGAGSFCGWLHRVRRSLPSSSASAFSTRWQPLPLLRWLVQSAQPFLCSPPGCVPWTRVPAAAAQRPPC
jgi:hypothetical protein